ncbi:MULTISPECIES: holo-ACP synthase [Gammaproteobacteria]|uniref:holo-ACP synthase n=1 Tax=Gammaproteobacteria TaxID=1236 RepID=UPI000DD0AE9E|nr:MULTISPECIES: holo-ACP synthase [Gammaproteobacteria]RTE87112.1 holo-ACP synthase [Aliidiomarina sp. B3213]TCZ93100.1 holo-ACP synthase [Lysobacter sp. N42]
MSVKGVGTDIVAVARIKSAYERQSSFAERILTPHELEEMTEVRDPERFIAKRFAAKEACLKALGTGLAKGMSWQDITISHTKEGQPLIKLTGQAEIRAKDLQATQFHLSISDETDFAVAFVIAEQA